MFEAMSGERATATSPARAFRGQRAPSGASRQRLGPAAEVEPGPGIPDVGMAELAFEEPGAALPATLSVEELDPEAAVPLARASISLVAEAGLGAWRPAPLRWPPSRFPSLPQEWRRVPFRPRSSLPLEPPSRRVRAVWSDWLLQARAEVTGVEHRIGFGRVVRYCRSRERRSDTTRPVLAGPTMKSMASLLCVPFKEVARVGRDVRGPCRDVE